MRIGLVIGVSSGGAGRHVHSLAGGLIGRGHQVAVVGPAATDDRFGFAATGAAFVPIEIGATPHPGRDAVAAARLGVRLAGADVVHAHGIRAGALCALSPGPPLAVTLHNAAPVVTGPRRLVYPVLERVVARRADAVLGVSGDLVRRMRGLGARRTALAVVAAPPKDPPRRTREEVRADLGIPEDRPLLLVVARLAAQKGLGVLLDAAPAIAGRTPRPVIAVAGDGPLHGALAARAAAEDLPVHLLGHRTDIADLLAAADLFVLPSFWEGPSLVIMEALRAGLPVVATRVGGIPDLYGDTARLVPPGDARALARAVGDVLDDAALAGLMRRASQRAAVSLPTEEDALDQVTGLYDRLVAP
ncbi:glycosyltransferase family 4 protein [Nocardiopsis sediminis]|uniref:Glycosyltransferase family 4 protein n=1 Tax=Nocardiopsis sediminis TaxID=1778267 RepID=A0ABV8FIM1_9ACTN